MIKRLLILLLIPYISSSQQQYSVNDLKDGKFKADSSYIYTLPFQHKKKVFLIQGYESMFSHKDEKALDFKIKKGTKICAARDGVVTGIQKDFQALIHLHQNLSGYPSLHHLLLRKF